MKTLAPGLTFYVCFGRYAGWGLVTADLGYRLVLGWVSIAIIPRDIEQLLALTEAALQVYEE